MPCDILHVHAIVSTFWILSNQHYGYILESRTNFIDCELEKDMA